jgi:hypothetical protein
MARKNTLDQFSEVTIKKVEVIKTFYVVEGKLYMEDAIFEYRWDAAPSDDGKREITRVLVSEEERLVEEARAVSEIERIFIAKNGGSN